MTGPLSDAIMDALFRYYGPVGPQLAYRNLYQLTVAVVLSAQTTDRQVNAVTGELFREFPDFKSLSAALPSRVEEIIRSTGFFRNKAAHIIALSKAVMQYHKGEVPVDFDSLVSLPGIGRKSANVILMMGHGVPAFPVDTHIYRIGTRLGYDKSGKLSGVEEKLREYIPETRWRDAHLVLIIHGRKLCKARKPLCSLCPVLEYCESAPRYLGAS